VLVHLLNEDLGHVSLVDEVGHFLGMILRYPGIAENLALPVDQVHVRRGELAQQLGELVIVGFGSLPAALEDPPHLPGLLEEILQSRIFIDHVRCRRLDFFACLDLFCSHSKSLLIWYPSVLSVPDYVM